MPPPATSLPLTVKVPLMVALCTDMVCAVSDELPLKSASAAIPM